MQWLWLLPSLGYGVYLFLSTGQPTGLIFAGFSAFALLGGALLTGRREPINLKDRVHIRSGQQWRAAIGNRILPRWQWLWHGDWVSRVYQDLEQENHRRNAVHQLKAKLGGSLGSQRAGIWVWLGFTGTDEVEIDLESEGAHALIVGATGAGKSQLLTCWLVSLGQKFDASQLQFWLLDFKGGATLGPLQSSPLTCRFATDLDPLTTPDGRPSGAVAFLEELQAELKHRQTLCTRLGVARLQDLPAADRPPVIVLAVDEAQHFLGNQAFHAPMIDLAARGRSLGIHLVLAAQSIAGIPRGMMTNLTIRIAVGKTDPVDLAQLGFQRGLAGADVAIGGDARADSAIGAKWGRALLISATRQVEFSFPSRGQVTFERLLGGLKPPQKNVVEAEKIIQSPPFGHHLPPAPTESVVIPKNTFDFSIGLEKQLQLTAENDIV